MNDDLLVYDDVGTYHYVALIDDGWWRWPAEAHGWARRARCQPSYVDRCEELPPRNAALALRLSGVSLS
jgi:hypothetical protein